VQQLTASWMMVDAGLKALASARTSRGNAFSVHVGVWNAIVILQHELHAAWVSAAKHMAVGDFDSAADHCHEILRPARR